MMKGKPAPEIDTVVAKLSSREAYFSHGSVIDHREANTLGLNVEYLKPEDETWETSLVATLHVRGRSQARPSAQSVRGASEESVFIDCDASAVATARSGTPLAAVNSAACADASGRFDQSPGNRDSP
jgi:hypothetical protein